MKTTYYTVSRRGLRRAMRVAVVADLHNGAYADLLARLQNERPQIIAVPGDFLDGVGQTENGLAFLAGAAKIAPTYCAIGNHERKAAMPNLAAAVQATGAELLDNRCVFRNGVWIGGLSSGWRESDRQSHTTHPPAPNLDFVRDFATREGCRILLCHHPEYYEPYLKREKISLILAGHAHGGQWEIFGQGIYAPGQGLFPKYTAGLYDDRLLVSRGLCRTRRCFPRFCNPRELVILDLWPKE